MLTADQATIVEHIEYDVRMHPEARKLLAAGVAQGVVRCEYQGLACQARPDWISPRQGLVAMLVCDRLSWLESTLRHDGIVHRLAFELALIGQMTESSLPAHVIAVEKRAPHRCGVWFISGRVLRKVRKENEQAMARYKQCRDTDRWPTGYEKLRVLNPAGF